MNELYPPNVLVDRLFNQMDSQTRSKGAKQLKLRENLKITKPGDRKTYIENFSKLCDAMGRNNDHLKKFLEKDLNVTSSINQGNSLKLDNTYSQKNIESSITKYVNQYIKCAQCGSVDTEFKKENKIEFILCKSCKSKKSVE